MSVPTPTDEAKKMSGIHPKVEALILLFRAKGIHAARSGREVMQALAAVTGDSSAQEIETLAQEVEANMQALIEEMPAYAPPVNAMQLVQFELDRALSQWTNAEELRAAIARTAASYQEWSEQARPRIAAHAVSLIPSRGTVFTFTLSETVLGSLREARARGLEFRVVVTESRPNKDGLATARALAEIGVEVHLTIDAGIADLARRADVMLIGAEAILADGSALCKTGTYPAALTMQRAGIPVYILVDSQKLHSISLLGLEPWLDPIDHGDVLPEHNRGSGRVVGHLFDRTPAGLITGLVTEFGILHPSQASLWMTRMPVNERLAARVVRMAQAA